MIRASAFLCRAIGSCALTATVCLLLAPVLAKAEPVWSDLSYTTFREMQSVNPDGSAAWNVPVHGATFEQGYKLRGVVLNNPAALLDGTPNYIPCASGTQWQLGAQWQVFIQATDISDFGGAALWMGQNYGNVAPTHWPDSSYSYTNAEWTSEINRVTLNNTLQPGDVVEVRARGGMFYKGKFNVNEQHNNDLIFNFDIVRLGQGALPNPTSIALADVLNTDGSFNFAQNRLTGPEHYQSTLVRLHNVSLVDPAGWGPNATLEVTDGTLRLPIKLGLLGFDAVAAPSKPFDVVGIFDQEGTTYKNGYYVWVTDASQFATVPEPGTVVMLVSGLAALSVFGWRRFRRKTA